MKRQPWHDALLGSLAQLSDLQAQRRAWVDRDPAFFSSPAELICQVFDDSGLSESLVAGPVFSTPADELLRELSRLADVVDVEQAPAQLLADPAWLKLASVAGRAFVALSDLLPLTHTDGDPASG